MKKTSIVFQGEHGAFSEQAAHAYFGKSVATIPVKSFDEVFSAVNRKRVTFGIIPIENSLHGSIHQNYDLLQNYNLHIVGEIKLRIVHALLANPTVTMKDVRYIFSHPQALGQCEKFLNTLNHVETIAFYDTAGAAKYIKTEQRTDAAAIASIEAANVYRLKILRSGIESNHQNFTRFLILSKKKMIARTNAKTSILFSTKDVPGSLFRALSVFALRDINLYKIESRPLVGKPWEYLFYLDFHGSILDTTCKNALEHLREITTSIKILGSYPVGKTVSNS